MAVEARSRGEAPRAQLAPNGCAPNGSLVARSGSSKLDVDVLASVVHPVTSAALLLLTLARVAGDVLARIVLASHVIVREDLVCLCDGFELDLSPVAAR